MKSYKLKNFIIQEFVDPSTYKKFGGVSILCIDVRLMKLMDTLRELFGVPITINNWKWGGDRQWSGIRTPDSPYYSWYSQHSYGRACDFLVRGLSGAEARFIIEKWYEEGLLGDDIHITMEYGDKVTWVHIDIRETTNWVKGIVNKFYIW